MKQLRLVRKQGKQAPLVHPGEWPEGNSGRRVLIENPDDADLWAHAGVLREAGYEVEVCHGPLEPPERRRWPRAIEYFEDPQQPQPSGERTRCPLLEQGRCSLVEGADVVVSTTSLADGREIIAALRSAHPAGLVVEATAPQLADDGQLAEGAVVIEQPVTAESLRAAVEQALATRKEEER